MKRTPTTAGVALLTLLAGAGMAACGSRATSDDSAEFSQTLQPVDDALAEKAERSCWFKVKNRTSRSEEVRLWNASTSNGARTERLGQLLIVTGAMEPAVRDARYYGCSLFEYTPGSPVVMQATAATLPVSTDNLIPYGFSRDGRKEIK